MDIVAAFGELAIYALKVIGVCIAGYLAIKYGS